MNKKLLVVGAVVAVLLAAVAVAGLVLPASDVSVVVGPKGDQGDKGPKGDSVVGPRGLKGDKGEPADPKLGGLSMDNFVPAFSINEVTHVLASTGFRQGTTTMCGIPTPSASSTLASLTVNSREATTTHALFSVFRTANRWTFATASQDQIGNDYDFPANGNEINGGRFGFAASSTINGTAGLDLVGYMKPSQMIVVNAISDNIEVSDADKGFDLDGECRSDFQLF